MINAKVISNGIVGLDEHMFRPNELVTYDFEEITENFDPLLEGYDLLIVPNGSDQVAMLKIKDKVRAFLDRGNTLFCFDGWFTNWIPGNRWIMDNSKKTIDIRYKLETDRYNFFKGVDVKSLNFSHGISGWWACGYIEPARGADVVMSDTWDRPLIVLDEVSTNGTMILTASGPVADYTYATTDDDDSMRDVGKLYRNFLTFIKQKKKVTS